MHHIRPKPPIKKPAIPEQIHKCKTAAPNILLNKPKEEPQTKEKSSNPDPRKKMKTVALLFVLLAVVSNLVLHKQNNVFIHTPTKFCSLQSSTMLPKAEGNLLNIGRAIWWSMKPTCAGCAGLCEYRSGPGCRCAVDQACMRRAYGR